METTNQFSKDVILESYSLPSSASFIKNNDFNLIEDYSWFVNRYTQVYADILKTFQKQVSGFNLVYGLDNDIIISYINPWLREAGHARLIEYFIKNDENYLTLIPGTVEEIYNYLVNTKKQQKKISGILEKLSNNNASDETIEAAKILFSKQGFSDFGKSINVDLKNLSLSLMELSNRLDFSLRRLESLLNDPRFIPLIDIYGDYYGSVYDEEIVESIYIDLANFRKEKKKSNYADAKNLATIIHHANYMDKKYRDNNQKIKPGYFVRLLTATNTLNKLDLRDKYSDYIGSHITRPISTITSRINHSSAIRTCYEAIFSTIIFQRCDMDYQKSLNFSYELYLKFHELEGNMLNFDWNDWKSKRFIGENDTTRIERFMREVNPDFYLDPCYLTLRNILVQDSIEILNKTTDFDEEHWWENDFDQGIRLKDDEINNLSRNILTNFSIIRNGKADNNLKNFGFTDLIIKNSEKNFFRWTLKNYFSKPEIDIFNLDILDEVLFASWSCSLRESQIIRLLNDFIFKQNNSLKSFELMGEIYLEFEAGQKIEKFCSLPQEPMTYNEYRKYIDLLPNPELKELIPSRIICDTNLFNICVDNQLIGSKPNQEILFTFNNTTAQQLMIDLFKRTSLWRENRWPYSEKLFSYINKKVKGFIENEHE